MKIHVIFRKYPFPPFKFSDTNRKPESKIPNIEHEPIVRLHFKNGSMNSLHFCHRHNHHNRSIRAR